MKFHTIALAAATTGFLAAAGACAWLLASYMPGYGPGTLFMDADIVAKLVMVTCLPLGLAILALGLIAAIGRSAAVRAVLVGAGLLSAALGLLGGAYVAAMIRKALAAVGPVSMAVAAPSWAEAALTAAVGLFGSMVALGLAAVGARPR